MSNRTAVWLIASVVGLTGCPDIDIDPGEGVGETPVTGPTVEFDPAASIIPFPNNLVRDPITKKVTLPAQPCETAAAKALREGTLDQLDGFGTYEARLVFTLTEAADPATVAGNVKLFQRTTSGVIEVPVVVVPTVSIRFLDATRCDMPSLIPALAVVSPAPLAQDTTYTVAVLDGLRSASGQPFEPSGTWLIARSAIPPVVFGTGADADVVLENHTPLDPADDAQRAQLHQIDLLWHAAQPSLDATAAAGIARDTVLLAWEFTTATVTDPLDPGVAGSVAAGVSDAGFLGLVSVTSGHGEAFLVSKFGASTCAAFHCNKVADIVGAKFRSTQYQTPRPNPLGRGAPVPGPWNDPIHPTIPTPELDGVLAAILVVPSGPAPANGWPTVIFGHGLGRAKEDLLAIGAQLANAGFASIAIDDVDHGSRAVRISNTPNAVPALSCADDPASTRADHGPDPTQFPQCYAPLLSTDLAATRDSLRQTILDLQRLSKALVTCHAGPGCAVSGGSPFRVDPTKIEYLGMSLGGILGSTFTAVSPLVKAAVLDVPAVGLVDVLENTQTLEIRCSLVNALIAAKVLQGDPWSPLAPTKGLCVAPDQGWKQQPGYLQFATIARWVLDPADGANFAAKLATKRFLIQEVIGDQVVPNIATEREGLLVGLTPLTADPATSATPPPSRVIASDPMTSKFVQYPTLPADPAQGFPGNTFAHGSLLSPATASADGKLGTARLQTDAIFFLFANR